MSQRQQIKKFPIRNAKATQQQILNSAELEFAQHGFNGTCLSTIAQTAGVTTATIHYYFRNKKSLYEKVSQKFDPELLTELDKLNLNKLPPDKALKTIVQVVMEHQIKYSHKQMLWLGKANRNRSETSKFNRHLEINNLAYLLSTIERGMAKDCFRSLDSQLTMLYIISICIFYFTVYENLTHLIPKIDLLDPQTIEHHTQATIQFILAGVEK